MFSWCFNRGGKKHHHISTLPWAPEPSLSLRVIGYKISEVITQADFQRLRTFTFPWVSRGLFGADVLTLYELELVLSKGVLSRQKPGPWEVIKVLSGGFKHLLFHSYLRKMNPFWRAYFSDGLKPPTRVWEFCPLFWPSKCCCFWLRLGCYKWLVLAGDAALFPCLPPGLCGANSGEQLSVSSLPCCGTQQRGVVRLARAWSWAIRTRCGFQSVRIDGWPLVGNGGMKPYMVMMGIHSLIPY